MRAGVDQNVGKAIGIEGLDPPQSVAVADLDSAKE